jgi:hypothetical protein
MRLHSTAMTVPIRFGRAAPRRERRSSLAARLRRLPRRRQQRRVRRAPQACARRHIPPHAVHYLIRERRRQALEGGEQRAHGFFIGVQRRIVPIQRRKASPEVVQTAGEVGQEGGGAGVGEGAADGDGFLGRRQRLVIAPQGGEPNAEVVQAGGQVGADGGDATHATGSASYHSASGQVDPA